MRYISFFSLFLVCCFLGGCLRTPIEEKREQKYASMETVVPYSVPQIEENLLYYFYKCGNARWLKPAKEGEPRQMVWGRQVNAREFHVDAWMDFEPLGTERALIRSHYSPRGRHHILLYLKIIQSPSICR